MKREERVEQLFLSTQNMIRGWRNYFQKALGPEKLSTTQMIMLFHIGLHQPVSGRDISEALQLSPSATSQLIEGLAARGYITRKSGSKDRRVTNFGLTPAGQAKRADLEMRRMEYFMSITSSLSDDDIDQMVQMQQKIMDEVKNQVPERGTNT